MRNPVDYAISHARLTLATLLFLLVAGFSAYMTIPKEAEPDVTVPIIYVNVTQRGISPEDAERLILRPLETQLKSVENVKEMRSAAFEGGGYVLLEFEAGFDSDVALADVRAKVDDAQERSAERRRRAAGRGGEPLALPGARRVARRRRARAHACCASPARRRRPSSRCPACSTPICAATATRRWRSSPSRCCCKSYGIALDRADRLPSTTGNSLVAAGALESGTGRFAVKVPALIETAEDILNFPIAVSRRRRRDARRRRRGAADLQGPDLDHPHQRQAGHHHRGVEAHGRQPDRDGRRDPQGRSRSCKKTWPATVEVDLHAGQVERHPHHAARAAEQRHHRRSARRRDHADGARRPRLAVHRHRHPRLVPRRHPRPAARRADRQHRRAVLADPRGRHAGRRRHHRLGIRRAADGARACSRARPIRWRRSAWPAR